MGFKRARPPPSCTVPTKDYSEGKNDKVKLSVGVLDLRKYYDSLGRKMLFIKLDAVGFGDRTRKLVQAHYPKLV